MTQTRTASQELAYIERRLFKGAGLDKASRLEGDERRAYRLAQVDRLLAEKNGSTPMAVYLSDWFCEHIVPDPVCIVIKMLAKMVHNPKFICIFAPSEILKKTRYEN